MASWPWFKHWPCNSYSKLKTKILQTHPSQTFIPINIYFPPTVIKCVYSSLNQRFCKASLHFFVQKILPAITFSSPTYSIWQASWLTVHVSVKKQTPNDTFWHFWLLGNWDLKLIRHLFSLSTGTCTEHKLLLLESDGRKVHNARVWDKLINTNGDHFCTAGEIRGWIKYVYVRVILLIMMGKTHLA